MAHTTNIAPKQLLDGFATMLIAVIPASTVEACVEAVNKGSASYFDVDDEVLMSEERLLVLYTRQLIRYREAIGLRPSNDL